MTVNDRQERAEPGVCGRCRGDGHYFQVPVGFNPFRAGGFRTAAVAYRVECFPCGGTGRGRP